jgi:hypothetical protein
MLCRHDAVANHFRCKKAHQFPPTLIVGLHRQQAACRAGAENPGDNWLKGLLVLFKFPFDSAFFRDAKKWPHEHQKGKPVRSRTDRFKRYVLPLPFERPTTLSLASTVAKRRSASQSAAMPPAYWQLSRIIKVATNRRARVSASSDIRQSHALSIGRLQRPCAPLSSFTGCCAIWTRSAFRYV